MATNCVLYRTSSFGTEVSQNMLDLFSHKLHRMVGIELQMINPTFLFQYLKGRCHGNQFSGRITYPPALIALSFRNEMGHRYLNVRINSGNDASVLCENFMKFSSVTPELTELICECQVRHGQKMAHLVKYLWICLTDFRNLFTV